MPSIDKDITQAVRETVTVESRNKIGRSQTQNPSAAPRPPQPPAKRSQSQDSAQIATEKKSGKPRAKKGSQHADVIDRLDFTGVGPMFHHDGPFDACAPSRNRHKTKAPMMAWTPHPTDDLSSGGGGGGPYPAPSSYQGFSEPSYEPPKKKVDAIAEAWGIHEPEPFEEFFAGGGTRGDTPASSIYNGKDSHAPRRPGKESRREEDSARSRNPRRSVMPPPQPIFIHDMQGETVESSSPPANSTGFPKRSKSIMQRIRKMRDAPNVPVDFDDPPAPSTPPAETSVRPTHRSQHSFAGRSAAKDQPSESFVYIDAHTNKDLPVTPAANQSAVEGTGTPTDSAAGGGLGRKTSIMKKVGRVVRGTR